MPCAARPCRADGDRREPEFGAGRFVGLWGIKMSIRVGRLMLLSSAAFISLHCFDGDARAGPVALPEVSVRASSPIVRRPPAARARVRQRHARGLRLPHRRRRRRQRADPAGNAADRHRPVRDRHRGPQRGDPAQHRPARSATSCSRKPGITGSSFAPGARAARSCAASTPIACASRRTASAPAASRTRRGSRRADRSAGGRADRGDPRPGDVALGLAGDRRRGQRRQQPHSHLDPAARRAHAK